MGRLRYKFFIQGTALSLLCFIAAGCESSQSPSGTEAEISRLVEDVQELKRRAESLQSQVAYQDELNKIREKNLDESRELIRDELNDFRREIASFKNGELVSFRMDLDAMQKRLSSLTIKLQETDR